MKNLSLNFRAALVSLAVVAAAFGVSQANAQSVASVANGRLSVQTASYAAVNGAGASASHAQVDASAYSTSVLAISPAGGAVNAAVGGGVNAVAYNTAVGSGVGSASAGGWADSSYNIGGSAPGVNAALNLDGGMGNAVLNGTDAHVIASTAQDGFANGTYAATGYVGGTFNPATGAVVAIVGGATQDTTAAAGAVTFTGGAPVGQTAAVRYSNSGVTTNVTADFTGN